MKYIYLIFTGFVFSANSIAQIEIQATHINPVIGETFLTYKSNAVSVGPSGPNVTWDLSEMVFTSTQSSGIESANSNFALTNSTTNINNLSKVYSLNNSVAQLMYGDLEGTVLISYSDPMQMLKFPIAYGMNENDTHEATYSMLGANVARVGTTNITSNSYGTLITPEGTYSNVIRVRLQMDYTDTYIGGSSTYNVIAYTWYKAGFHKELASIVQITSPQGITSHGQYLETTSLALSEIENDDFIVYPNPASTEISCRLENNKGIKSIQVLNIAGQVEKEISVDLSQTNTLNIEGLNSGIYFLRITTSDNEMKIVKFAKD